MRKLNGEMDAGFALLIVLWSLVLITFIVTQVTSNGRSAVMLSSNLRRAAALQAETDGALHLAIFNLLSQTSGWSADGSEHSLRLPGALILVRASSESVKINPNIASTRLLSALLQVLGENPQQSDDLAINIVEWRSPSNENSVNGKKALRYRQAGRDYAPPSSGFQSIEELGLVLGITPELLQRLAPHITIYASNTDAHRADPVVARALVMAKVFVPPGPAPKDRVVMVTASATAVGGAHFVRQAIVSIGLDQFGIPFRILTWTTLAS